MKQLITLLLSLFSLTLIADSNITVKGSDTMIILGQKWAEVYMQKNPSVKIQVTGGGSGTGFAALQNKQTDIAQASRKIKSKEIEQCIKTFGKRPKEYVVALDGLSVYINKNNPISSLSIEEIRDIYTGKITNWKDVGGENATIILYSRENNSGTYEFFKEHVLSGKDFDSKVQTLAGTAQVIQAVGQDKNAIGYGGAAYGGSSKHIKISLNKGEEAIDPTEKNVITGKYPISRKLYLYLDPSIDNGIINDYIKWILNDGQIIVKDVGYYPLPKNNN